MRRLYPLGIALLVIVILGGSIAYAQDKTPTPTEILDQGNAQFAFELYHAVQDQQDNMVFSPFSISQALAMVYAGARGETGQQIADTLHFTLPQNELHAAFADLNNQVSSDTSDYAFPFQLNIANAVWVQDGFQVQPDYAATLDADYNAGLQRVDFASAPEDSRNTINQWVSDRTQDRIKDLLGPGTVSPLTRLILTNAIYFNAAWELLFNPDNTRDESFTLLDGSTVDVPMMHLSGQFDYVQADNYQVIVLNYQPMGSDGMLIVLPDEGEFATVQDALDGDWFQQTLQALDEQFSFNINLGLPRFKSDMSLELSNTLADMGMPDAFSASADFTGIADPAVTGQPLSIGFVIHKAYIDVNEHGTEAAAATALGLGGGGPPNEPFDVVMNRPFIYLIYNRYTQTILFMGRVLNPAENS